MMVETKVPLSQPPGACLFDGYLSYCYVMGKFKGGKNDVTNFHW